MFAPIRDYLDTLVHPSAQQNALTAARHRAFIAPRLFGGVVALAAIPIYLIVRGAPNAIELTVFAWLAVPILIAFFVSRTGRYERAHVLSSLALTGLATSVAYGTGGIASFAAIWLVVVPLEAALCGSRRVVATASIFAVGAAGLLVLLGVLHAAKPPEAGAATMLAAFGIVSAVLYATGLALGAEALSRTGLGLLCSEEERYRLLAGNMTDAIARHGRDGGVLFMSPAAEGLFGCPVAALHAHGLFDRVHVADRPAFLTALGDAGALSETRTVEFRARRDRADAAARAPEFVWIEMRCRPVGDAVADSGSAGGSDVVAVLRDVSERKRQEQALAAARAEDERANERRSRFLATMSHELRTPLNAIIGFSEMLMKESTLTLDAARRAEYAALINESGSHLLAVVNGILDMSKIETDNFTVTLEPFAPAQAVAVCCDLVALRAREAGVEIEKSVEGNLPELIADRRAVTQILLNLLSNAIRFSDRGGTIAIGARADGTTIVFTVEDHGIGISEDDLARIGEPYFQAGAAYDRRQGGTGLGLSIVKGLIRLHGGDMSIRSRIGEGTRVAVRLPRDCERARESGRQGSAQAVERVMALSDSVPHQRAALATTRTLAAREQPRPRDDLRVKKSA